ncbi:acetylcholine receptor subunit beta-type unc-29 [Aplysia californica]|uniref:Acetylcholine receptor subunit beta-type unc-29 n=1 Tax=Aplysia californica TaxID=6500 RepID=A0ABM0K5H6_APLCA|nr:acetylcholine receptor subunit beta-type unc-29 [Aplysia californica]
MSEIILSPDKIWTPRLVVENPIEKISVIADEIKPPIRIQHDGLVVWYIPSVLKVYCETRILSFPFDSQTCVIKIYAWGYTDKEIYMFPRQDYSSSESESVLNLYSPNGEWIYEGSSIQAENVPSGRNMIQRVRTSLRFRRKWVFLSLTLIVPAVLCSLLMSAVFVLPFECGEKMSYSLTVLLTFIVLLTLVADSLPPISTEISVLQIYLTGVMCMGTVATLLTAGTVTMYSRPEDDPVPRWVISTCDKVFRPFACKTKASSSSSSDPRNKPTSSNSEITRNSNGQFDARNTNNTYSNLHNSVDCGRHSPSDGSATSIGSSGRGASRQYINNADRRDRKYNDLSEDAVHFTETGVTSGHLGERPGREGGGVMTTTTWKDVAHLVDAVCLRVISLTILVGTCSLVLFYTISY